MSSIKVERIKQTFKEQASRGAKIFSYEGYGITVEFKDDYFMAFGLTNREKQELYKFCKKLLSQ